jgi:hypothetical protein
MFIRSYSDKTGPGQGANDMAVLPFRIPDPTDAAASTTGLLQPLVGGTSGSPFDVPSIPGAHGCSVQITSPVRASQQVVVFRTGKYGVMVELAPGVVGHQHGVLQSVPGHYQGLPAVHGSTGG